MFLMQKFPEEGGGFGPDFTKEFFESTHLNKGFEIALKRILKLIFSGFFDENFPGNAADLSFKDHSFSSNHGEVVTANVFHSLSQFTKYICTGKRHARPAQFFQGHRHGVDRRHFIALLSRITKYWQ